MTRIFDLHCDTLVRLLAHRDGLQVLSYQQVDGAVPSGRMDELRSNEAHLALDRMQGIDWCQCFAVFIPDDLRGDDAWRYYCAVRDFWKGQLSENSDLLCHARASAEAEAAFGAGKKAGILTVEGAAFLQDDGSAPGRLDAIAHDGVRMVTLTWNGKNALGSGNDSAWGLTRFGRLCVGELEARDIVVDVSHLNDAGFKDLLETAQKPFVASHSNARAVCGRPRNLADWQLREIAERQGLVGLNYFSTFLRDDGGPASPDDALRHVEHLLAVAGEDVLALGSDFDGCDLPEWIDSCDKVPAFRQLVAQEFGEAVAEKMFYSNAARFFAG